MFYQTASQSECDAVYRSERAMERVQLQAVDNMALYESQNPRLSCTNIQHELGGDCPSCDVLLDDLFLPVIDAMGHTVYLSDLYGC
jgi:hypothetical protein